MMGDWVGWWGGDINLSSNNVRILKIRRVGVRIVTDKGQTKYDISTSKLLLLLNIPHNLHSTSFEKHDVRIFSAGL